MVENDLHRQFATIREFEWDENKRRAHITKHGIDFADAKDVFADPAAYTYSSRESDGEQRFVTIGIAKGTRMAVIFAPRGKLIRIISAPMARRNERQTYGRKRSKEKRQG
jgi:uncharacterized protein